MMLIEYLTVSCEVQPDWDCWCLSVAVAFTDWIEQNVNRLSWSIDQYPDEILMLSPWLSDIGGLFPPAGWSWQEFVTETVLNSDDNWITATPEMFEDKMRKIVEPENQKTKQDRSLFV